MYVCFFFFQMMIKLQVGASQSEINLFAELECACYYCLKNIKKDGVDGKGNLKYLFQCLRIATSPFKWFTNKN